MNGSYRLYFHVKIVDVKYLVIELYLSELLSLCFYSGWALFTGAGFFK